MKLCGVAAEYNPFHNGHAYQLKKARELSGCDRLIVCMNGSVSQRGDVMLLDKWQRTRMALNNGADVVVELPALFGTRTADAFACGAMATLVKAGVDAVSFGCETDDTETLQRLSEAFHCENDTFRAATEKGLSEGQTFARARGGAVAELTGIDAELLNLPNTVLAAEYLNALKKLNSSAEIVPVLRRGSYHSEEISELSSASAIRRAIEEQRDWENAVPENCAGLIRNGNKAQNGALDSVLLYLLRSSEDLGNIWGADEGIENLFRKAASVCTSREELLEMVKCKRYTYVRLNRFCMHVLLHLTKRLVSEHPEPTYIRVLGFRRDASDVLKVLKERAKLPLITDCTKLKDDPVFRFERRATDLQALAMREKCDRDFTEQIVIV